MPRLYDQEFARLLPNLRQIRSITRDTLAASIGRPTTYVAAIETRQRAATIDDVVSICKALQIDATDTFRQLLNAGRDIENIEAASRMGTPAPANRRRKQRGVAWA